MLLSSFFSHGQAIIKEIKGTNPKNKDLIYSFPEVIIPNKKKISDKINDELVSDFLDADRKKIKKSIFENVWSIENRPTLNDVSYEIITNDRTLLNISISADGCGAYCEYFTQYFTFDMRNGSRIILDSLLNSEGAKILIDSLNEIKKRTLNLKLKEIKDSLGKPATQEDKGMKEYYTDMEILYTECLERKMGTLEYLQFYITRSELFIVSDRCSAHYNRNLDEISDFRFTFILQDWNRYFTPYTLRLLKK